MERWTFTYCVLRRNDVTLLGSVTAGGNDRAGGGLTLLPLPVCVVSPASSAGERRLANAPLPFAPQLLGRRTRAMALGSFRNIVPYEPPGRVPLAPQRSRLTSRAGLGRTPATIKRGRALSAHSCWCPHRSTRAHNRGSTIWLYRNAAPRILGAGSPAVLRAFSRSHARARRTRCGAHSSPLAHHSTWHSESVQCIGASTLLRLLSRNERENVEAAAVAL
jgi:hypothetical protein